MKVILFTLILFVSLTAIAQQSIFYDISLENESNATAFNKYSSEIAKILSYKIESSQHLKKRLLQESFNTKSDTVSFIATYWCQENGVILPYMFGSSLTRETPAHKELKKILSRFRISPKDMKKLTRFTGGDQVHLYFNYRKVTNPETKHIHFEYFVYKNTPLTLSNIYTNQRNPIYKGCNVYKKHNQGLIETQQKIKNCMSKKIDKLIKNNFNTVGLSKHPFLRGRQISILTSFTFSKNGHVININSVSLRPELEKEAIRVFTKIPLVTPATVDNKPVDVIYTKPITFLAN